MNLSKIIEEYSKVQWPKKKDIVTITAWVIAMSVALGIYLGLFDMFATRVLSGLKIIVSRIGG